MARRADGRASGRRPKAASRRRRPVAETSRALLTLAAAVDGIEDLDQVLETVARVTPQLLGLTRCGLFLWDPVGRALSPAAAWGLADELRQTFLALDGPPRIPGVVRALESREPVVVDVAAVPSSLPAELATALDIRSMLIVPLVSSGRLVGTMTLDTPGVAHPFTVGRIALARALTASLDLGTVLQRVVEGARDLCGSDTARIALRDPSQSAPAAGGSGDSGADGSRPGVMVFRHWVGACQGGYEGVRIRAGTGGGGEVLRTGRPFRTDNYAADPRVSQDRADVAREEGVVAELTVPIRIGEEIEGLLFVDNRSARPFSDRDEAVLLRLADHAGIAIRNARLYAETERRRKTAEVLAGVGRLLSETLEADAVSLRIADSVRALVGAHSSTLYRLDPESNRLLALADSGEAFPRGTGFVGAAVRARAPVVTADLLDDPRLTLSAEARGVLPASPFRAALAVPLTVKGRVIGAMAVADRTGRVFEEAMRHVARAAGRALGADMVGAYFLDPRREALVPVAGYRVPKELLPTLLQTPFPLERFPMLREAWATGRPVWTADYRNDPRIDQSFLAAARPGALLSAPTPVRGEFVAACSSAGGLPGPGSAPLNCA